MMDRSPEKTFNQMLNVAIYITKIWPSELLFYPIQLIEFLKTVKHLESGSGDDFKVLYEPYRNRNVKSDEICFKSAKDMTTILVFTSP